MSESPTDAPSPPARPRRRGRIALGLLAAVVIAGGGAVWWYKSQPYHFLVSDPGALYRSGRLEPDVLTEVIEKYGIRTVVNLKGDAENQLPWHAGEVSTTEAAGARHLDIAMDPDTPPTPEQIDAWLELFRDQDRNPVLVHCQHGVIRTGMLVAVYEMEFQGKSGAQALADMESFGHDLQSDARGPMREFVRTYAPRSGGRD